MKRGLLVCRDSQECQDIQANLVCQESRVALGSLEGTGIQEVMEGKEVKVLYSSAYTNAGIPVYYLVCRNVTRYLPKMALCFLSGDRGEPGPHGPASSPLLYLPLILGENGDVGLPGGTGFPGPRGMHLSWDVSSPAQISQFSIHSSILKSTFLFLN